MKKILFLLLFTIASYGQAVFDEGIQITGNANSATATKVNVQEANGEVNTQTINTGFNKNIGLGGSDVVGANTLLNQYSTTPVDWTATTFNSGQVVFYGGKQWIAKIATVAGDVPAVSSKWEEITFEALANKTVIVDAIPTDGSNNAVSSNGVFDALATKAPISSVHNPVTLGTANGLSLSTQQLSLGLASSGVTGALSGTDWNTFNGKFNTPTGLTTNYLPKWNGSGFGNSNIVDTNNEYYFENTNGRLTFGTSLSETYIFSTTTSFTSFKKLKIISNNLVFNNGTTDLFSFLSNGRALFNTTTDNGVDKVQVNGTISASPATTANQVPTWGQVQAAARPYKVYTALLTQTGSNIPAVTVIENTLGATISYSLGGTGFVVATSSTTSFTDPNKVFISISNGNGAGFFSVLRIQTNQVRIVQQNIAGANTDGLLQTANFEIRVYN